MPHTLREPQTLSRIRRFSHLIAPVVVMLIAAAVYNLIYFREATMPTGVGANLVPAERMLKGEVPYRDFYKIQTPGILLLNAGLFKLFGTTLLTAWRGVLVFKLLTLAMVFVVSRRVISWRAALIPTVLAFVWLPPGGPFRPAPIQYEMLFTLVAVYLTLRWLDSRLAIEVFAAGLAVGLIAVLKQNVGVYAAIALVLSIMLSGRIGSGASVKTRESFVSLRSNSTSMVAAVLGVAIPVAGLLVYLAGNHALGAAMRVFVKGPSEHIQMKLTGYPLPTYALLVLIVGGVGCCTVAVIARRFPRLKQPLMVSAIGGAFVCAFFAPQALADNCVFWFSPILFFYGGWLCFLAGRGQPGGDTAKPRERTILLVVLLFSVAAYLEVFPRSVRGLVIGTLPLGFILMVFVFTRTGGADDRFGFSGLRRFQLALVAVIALVFGARLIAPHYFKFEAWRVVPRADTELSFVRGRGIYLPAERAAQIDSVVELIWTRVPEDGYFFAHALTATPYYFLADRNSPTGATLWNDAGTNDAERARTMRMLREKDVRLVLTGEEALAAERYAPLVDFLKDDFHISMTIGKTIFLERNY